MTLSPGPLEGLKVVDFGAVAVEPVSTKHLADYGATVIRVESHRSPDLLRFTRPYYKLHIDGSMYFANYNTSKLSVSLDLTKPTGMDICWRIVKWADVLSCGRPKKWMAKWGLDYDSVRAVKPEIIYYMTNIVGSSGPDSGFSGIGVQGGALMGVQQLTRWPNRGPSNAAGILSDAANFLCGPIAILSALEYRDRTGEGQLIDHAHVEGYLSAQSPWLLDYPVNGRIATGSGNRYPLFADSAPYGVFPCQERDGKKRWVAICVTTPEEWRSFCKVIGQPDWMQDVRFSTPLSRIRHQDELDELISGWTFSHTAEKVESMMQEGGVPASAVMSNRDLFEDPHLKDRGFFRWLEHSELGSVPFSGPPFRLSKTPDTQSAGPCMGEHNEYVLTEILGMSDEDISDAIVEGGMTTELNLAYAHRT